MTTKVRALAVLGLMTIAMWLSGCGHYVCTKGFGDTTCSSSGSGGKSSSGSGTGTAYLFIADAGGVKGEIFDNSAATISLNPNFNGGQAPVSTNVPGGWIALAQEQYLYAGYADIGEIYGWSIAGDGTLTSVSGAPYPATELLDDAYGTLLSPTQAMITNPAGTLLFTIDETNEQVNVYQIGTDGSLTGPVSVQLPSGFKPFNLATDGLGKYLYVSNDTGVETTEVAVYGIGSTGTLTSAGSPQALAMRQMQGDSAGKYMIGTPGGQNGQSLLYVMSVNQSTGALTAVGGSPFATQNPPVTVAVQPNSGGTLVYSFASNQEPGVVEGFTIDLSTGILSTISGSPFSAVGVDGSFDQSGQYLFVEESSSNVGNSLDAFNVGTSSTLTTPVASIGWAPGAWAVVDVP